MKKALFFLLSLILISNINAQQGKGMLSHIEEIKDNNSFGNRPLKGKTYTYKVHITGGSATVEFECENGTFDNGKTYKMYHDTHSFSVKITWSETANSGKIKATTPSNHLSVEYGVNIEDIKVYINGPNKIKYGETATYHVTANPNISVTSTNWTAGNGLIVDGSHTQGEFKVRAQNNLPLNTNVRLTASTNYGSLTAQKNIEVEPVLSLTSNRNPGCLNENVTFTIIGAPATGATIKWRTSGLVSGQGTPSATYKMGSYPHYFSISPEVIISGKSYYPELMIWVGPPLAARAEKEYSIGFNREPVQLTTEFSGLYSSSDIRWEIVSGQAEIVNDGYEQIWIRSTASLDFSDIVVKSTVSNRCGTTSMLHRVKIDPIRTTLKITPKISEACIGSNVEFQLEGDYMNGTIQWIDYPTNNSRVISGQGTTKAVYSCYGRGQTVIGVRIVYRNYYGIEEEVILNHAFDIVSQPTAEDKTYNLIEREELTINGLEGCTSSWQILSGYCNIIEQNSSRITIKPSGDLGRNEVIKIKGTFRNECGTSSAIYTINVPKVFEILGPDNVCNNTEAEYTISGPFAGKAIHWYDREDFILISGQGTATAKFRANYVPYLDPIFPISVRVGNTESEYEYFIKWISLEPCTSKSLAEPIEANPTFSARLYPNPTNGIFKVELPDDIGDMPKGRYTIANVSGGIVKRGDINSKILDLDISGSPAGTYILSMTIDNRTSTLRIIKK